MVPTDCKKLQTTAEIPIAQEIPLQIQTHDSWTKRFTKEAGKAIWESHTLQGQCHGQVSRQKHPDILVDYSTTTTVNIPVVCHSARCGKDFHSRIQTIV